MSEAENATKAPESDAQQDQPAPSAQTKEDDATTPAPAEPVFGEHCVTDRPTPSGQSSTGEIIKLNGIETYISKPPDYPHTPSRLLLFLTSGTGVKSTNNQIQADKYAAHGYLVLAPDFLSGDSTVGTAITDDSTSLLEQVKIKAVEIAKSFVIDMFLARVTKEKVLPILHKVIEAAKDEYADSIKHGEGIYAVGYCVGARYVALLAQGTEKPASDEEAGNVKAEPLIKAGALAHAASIIPDDFNNLQAPLSFVCVENDPLFPDEVRSAGEEAMSKANLEHEVQVYPGVPHGFAVVGEYAESSIRDSQAKAFDQMLDWLQSH